MGEWTLKPFKMSTAPAIQAGTDSNSAELQLSEAVPVNGLQLRRNLDASQGIGPFFRTSSKNPFMGGASVDAAQQTAGAIILLMKIWLNPGRHVALVFVENRRHRGFGFGEQRAGATSHIPIRFV